MSKSGLALGDLDSSMSNVTANLNGSFKDCLNMECLCRKIIACFSPTDLEENHIDLLNSNICEQIYCHEQIHHIIRIQAYKDLNFNFTIIFPFLNDRGNIYYC